jgi:hypothetical protein
MQIRQYVSEDYIHLKKWFKDWDSWTPCAELSIPVESSFIVEDEGVPFLFSCYYKTNSDIAVMGFTISDRCNKKDLRTEATSMLMSYIKSNAKENNFNILYYSTDSSSKHMVDHFVQAGGVITDNADAYIAAMALNEVDIDFFVQEE